MTARELLDNNFDNLVETIRKTCSFNTEKGKAEDGAPFGKEVRNCLDYVLNTAKEMGFETFCDDGYAGHVDYKGTGKEVLGILGHLDVVPANPAEWKYPPFAGETHDGKLYARGTMDDKGPMIACLFAVKALKDSGFVPSKTIRLIFGCDEESGMECVEHYFKTMPFPSVSFSPDGDFPVINREKGIYQFNVICGKLPQGVSITAGDRANVVPSKCNATVPNTVDEQLAKSFDVVASGNTLYAEGKAAHGSTPDEGINATHKVLKLLASLYPQNQTLQFVSNLLTDTTGARWGIALSDKESGKLTCNLGVIRTQEDGTLVVTMDIRFPVTFNCDKMHQLLVSNTPNDYRIEPGHISEPLFVPSESNLVTTLMDVYNSQMHTNLDPLAIGGGTYSRCLPNCVAFGPLFPGEEQTIHMPNENIILENLKTMSHLYLDAITRLSK